MGCLSAKIITNVWLQRLLKQRFVDSSSELANHMLMAISYILPSLSLSLSGVVRVLVRDEPAAVVLRGARNSLLSHSDYYNTASCQNPVNRSQLGMQK